MASVKFIGTDRHGKRKYRVQYWTPTGARRTKHFRSKKDADTFAATIEADKARGAFTDPKAGRVTLGEFWTGYLARAEQLGKPRATTLEQYRSLWTHYVEPALGARSLGSIRRGDVAAMVDEIANHGSKHQAAGALKLVRMLLNRAIKEELIAINRAALLEAPTVKRERPRVLDPAELARLVEETPDRWRALVLLNAWGAFRWSEVIGLDVSHVDFLRRQVRIERALAEVRGGFVLQDAKTSKSRRTVPIPAFVVEALAEHVRRYPPVSGEFGELLFANDDGTPLYRSAFWRKVWKPATGAAGLQGVKIRHLRHTGASLVLEAGGNLKDVAERLGHTTTRMADELYVELYESRGRELVARMEQLARGDEDEEGTARARQ